MHLRPERLKKAARFASSCAGIHGGFEEVKGTGS